MLSHVHADSNFILLYHSLRHFFSCLLSSAPLFQGVENDSGCLKRRMCEYYSGRAFRTSPYAASWVAWRAYPA